MVTVKVALRGRLARPHPDCTELFDSEHSRRWRRHVSTRRTTTPRSAYIPMNGCLGAPACGVGLDTCCMVEVGPERFEVMVSEALDGIPGELGRLMSNVAVTVQHDSGPAGLLGLYEGVPLTRRSSSYAGALPDRITIYRPAICAVCDSEAEVVEQVRRTVIHEVGHHFGIGDARLRELGW
jgi:predicted Zn-dependent protease with MMP-like domain